MQQRIDPLTADYDGTRIEHLGNAVYLRLMTPRGGYWPDATFGSRLHELQREKDVVRVARLAEQYSAQALQPLLDDGRARSIDIATERQAGRLALQVEVVDASGAQWQFKHYVALN